MHQIPEIIANTPISFLIFSVFILKVIHGPINAPIAEPIHMVNGKSILFHNKDYSAVMFPHLFTPFLI